MSGRKKRPRPPHCPSLFPSSDRSLAHIRRRSLRLFLSDPRLYGCLPLPLLLLAEPAALVGLVVLVVVCGRRRARASPGLAHERAQLLLLLRQLHRGRAEAHVHRHGDATRGQRQMRERRRETAGLDWLAAGGWLLPLCVRWRCAVVCRCAVRDQRVCAWCSGQGLVCTDSAGLGERR